MNLDLAIAFLVFLMLFTLLWQIYNLAHKLYVHLAWRRRVHRRTLRGKWPSR